MHYMLVEEVQLLVLVRYEALWLVISWSDMGSD